MIAFDPRYEVVASWAPEFLPVNCSVIFLQPRGDEAHIIGSESFIFERLADCIAKVRTGYPWRAGRHLVPATDDNAWGKLFGDLGLRATPVLQRDYAIATVITQALLGRVYIDTQARPWAPEGNNELLIDSLNGYSVREKTEDVFTTQPLEWQYQRYLVSALERYACWDCLQRSRRTRAPNYAQQDRAVI